MNIENITNIVVECPHCKEPVLIEKINCCIFRHASFTPFYISSLVPSANADFNDIKKNKKA